MIYGSVVSMVAQQPPKLLVWVQILALLPLGFGYTVCNEV